MKILYIVRGLPGSGKSTFAKSLDCPHFEADMFFTTENGYNFVPEKIRDAHDWCYNQVMNAMIDGNEKVAVSNTFTREWEFQKYYDLAKEHNYIVFSIIVENRHGGINEHNVPDDVLTKMKSRFEIML